MATQNIKIKQQLNSKSELLLEKIKQIQFKHAPKPFESYLKSEEIQNTNHQLSFLIESIDLQDKGIFANYIDWLKKYYSENDLPKELISLTLHSINDAIGELFPDDVSTVVNKNIQSGLSQLGKDAKYVESYIDITQALGPLAFEYNLALLNGDRKKAGDLILSAVESGEKISNIYLNVFQVSQYEIGRLWLDNKITVAKEHFCTAATQQIMSQLYPYIFSTQRNGNSFVAANVGKELHEIGIRMVADFFEMDGWDTYYLGSNTPTFSIIDTIEENNAKVVGLSIAMWFHVPTLKKVILELREKYNDSVKILIGGQAFLNSTKKWKELNADGYAKDALSAVELANKIVN